MGKITILSAVFASVMLVIPCFASMPPVTYGLVGFWKFDEVSLVTAIDSSGNGNNGTMMNTAYLEDTPSPSLSESSLLFNNTNGGNAYSYVTIPDSPSLRPSSGLTIAAWVKTNSTELRDRHIVAKQYGSGMMDSFVLWYRYDGTLSLYIENGTSHPHISTELPSANEWHHIVGTYDGSYMWLYVDGVERANGTLTGSIPYDSNAVLIGAEDENPDNIPEAGWNGLIDEVLIYNRGLSQAEVAALARHSELYGVVGNHLVMVDRTTGDATEVGIINATDLWGMTYDPYRDALYCVANQTTDPELVIIDRATANATVVGPIDLEGYLSTYLGFVESLAFNPLDGILYASAGTAAYLSDMLIRIDPETGNATSVAQITGTTQNDGDSMVFINGTLYLVDSDPYSTLYTINFSTGVATSVGDLNDFTGVMLAYDPETQTLFGSARNDRLLIEISPYTSQYTDIGPTHTADEFEGAVMGLIAVVFDGSPPDIGILIQNPSADSVQAFQNVTISANITDFTSGVRNVTLRYTTNTTNFWTDLPMNYNSSTGVYECIIPGQEADTLVYFEIQAYDNALNHVTSDNNGKYYSYATVVPEFPSFLILPTFMIATLLAVMVCRRKYFYSH